MIAQARAAPLYRDDIHPGDRFVTGERVVEESEMIAFAKAFDPQPFHTDPEAAQHTFFRGLAASGWHTAAITMSLLVKALPFANGLIGAGSDISWPRPTRPGDTLRAECTVLEITPSSRPGQAIALVEIVTLNQRDEICQKQTTRVMLFSRPT